MTVTRMGAGWVVGFLLALAGCGSSGEPPARSNGPVDGGEEGSDAKSNGLFGPDATSVPHDGASSPEAATPAEAAAPVDSSAKPSEGAAGPIDAGPSVDATAASDAGPSVRLIGRFDLSNPASSQAEWSASAMEANFSGTSVTARLGGNANYFAVVVDGNLQPTLVTDGGSTYAVTSGLSAGTHDVLVFRRDEPFDEPSQFLGFTFGNGGALLAPPPTPARRIEVIGDSISAGYGDECTNASQPFAAATEDEYVAYGPLAARSFGADVHVIAWSGKGLYRNDDGSMTETMPILWQRTIPTDATSMWNPSQWVPDVVVINLGTNDYNADSTDPSVPFQSAYLTFVATLRTAYPNAFILAAVGPMLSGTSYTSAKTVITNVVSMRASGGDTRMALVEFPTQNCGEDGSMCGCDYHPNIAEHQTMATILEGAIHTAVGW